jgi:hypothetical protein
MVIDNLDVQDKQLPQGSAPQSAVQFRASLPAEDSRGLPVAESPNHGPIVTRRAINVKRQGSAEKGRGWALATCVTQSVRTCVPTRSVGTS